LLHKLRTAINERNSGKIQEIQEMQDQQKSLEQVMKSAKTKIMQASMLPAID
jgi:hypothetical protein